MNSQQRAIVIGSSLAGLWTARVLANHFEQVTVLERDQLPTEAASRAGVPQDKHVHVLLERGAQIMSQLFPGITDELLAAGANRVDLTQDSRAKIRGQWLPQFQSGIVTYACSRLLLESILRQRVAALPNVELCGGAQVQGLVASNGVVEGVRVRWKDGREEGVETAVFVVDASGRGSKLPDWLQAIGYDAPEETVIDVRLGYAGRRYKIPTPAPDWDMMLIGAEPPHKSRAGLIYSEENGIWMVMVAGILGDYPPTDEEGFLAFAQEVDPEFHAAIAQAEPVSNIIGYRRTENRFRRYDQLNRWPDRLVALGDAVCGFNPIYGQGMSVSAMAAVELGEMIGRVGNGRFTGVAQSFQKKYPKIVEPAWLLATSADLEWLGNEEATSLPERFAGWYMPKVLDAIPDDQIVHKTFIQVQNLIVPPTSLFRPNIAWRVLHHSLRG